MKKSASVTIVVALLSAGLGALAVHLFGGDRTPPAAPAAEQPAARAPKATIPEVPGAVERALRRRIRQLEGELKAARELAANPTNAPARPEIRQMPGPDQFRPPNPQEMMENLKKNDPKKYEEFQKRFSQMRQRRLERTKGRLEFFGSVDTSGMTDAERKNHEKLQELLAQREELQEPPEMNGLTEEEMRQQMQRRRELDRAIRQASATERTTLLNQTASALGLEGDDAKVLTDTLQEVIRATESDRHGPPPMPGR